MILPSVTETPVYWGRLGRKSCPGYKAIVDGETGRVFTIASDRYKVLFHEHVLGIISDCIDKMPEYGKPEATVYTPDDGARLWAKYTFPEVEYDIGGGDIVHPTIEVRNSYDLRWAFSIIFGAFRLVCSNGLVVGKKVAHYRHIHTRGLEVDHVRQILIKGMEQMSDEIQLWRTWLDRVTTSSDYEYAINTMGFHKKELEEIEREIEVSSDITLDDVRLKTLSYWIFYNLIAQYVTHKIEDLTRRAELTARMSRAFYRR